jgi:hypothetical protein
MRRFVFVIGAVVLGALAACATLKKDQTVCPEFRNLRCAGRTLCDMDHARGCRVCQCEDATTLGDPGPPENPTPQGL